MKKSIALQLSHPDAFFADLTGDANGVSGIFEGDTVEAFDDVSAEEFLWAAQRLDYICEYEPRKNTVWLYDGYEGQSVDAGDYISETCREFSNEANAILKEVFRARLESEMREIRAAINADFPDEKIKANVDADFCAAVLRLADIIRQTNEELEYETTH
jgi:hypothetical protein